MAFKMNKDFLFLLFLLIRIIFFKILFKSYFLFIGANTPLPEYINNNNLNVRKESSSTAKIGNAAGIVNTHGIVVNNSSGSAILDKHHLQANQIGKNFFLCSRGFS